MKKTAIFTMMLVTASLTAIAADENMATTGSGYTYLALELSNGTSQTVTANGLKITFANGVVTATNGDEKVSVALSSLSRMYYTNTPSTSDIGTVTGINVLDNLTIDRYDLQGHKLSDGQHKKGVYIVRKNGKTTKAHIK